MNFLHRLAITLQKKAYAISEPIRMEDVCNMTEFNSAHIVDTPFRHVVIDNAFTKEFYNALCEDFKKKYASGIFTKMKDEPHKYRDATQPYDGYLAPLYYEDGSATSFLFTNQWNLYFSKIFKRPTNQATSLAYHFHKEGDQTGWIHTDYSIKKFDKRSTLANGIILPEKKGSDGSPNAIFSSRRAIAIVYYFNNDADRLIGGETALFRTPEDKSPTTLITPINNRIFAFSVTPTTFHVFQKNYFDRASLVQWFHVDTDWTSGDFDIEARSGA
jgi:hypothetical protein